MFFTETYEIIFYLCSSEGSVHRDNYLMHFFMIFVFLVLGITCKLVMLNLRSAQYITGVYVLRKGRLRTAYYLNTP